MNFTALSAWYLKLAPRDRRTLRFGAIAVGIIVVLWVVLPLQRNLSKSRAQLAQQQQDLEWMKRQAPTLAAAGPGAAAAGSSHEQLVVVIDRTARESGLGKAWAGTQPAGNNAWRVQFANADFNLLLGWLHRLATQQGLHIEDANITSSGNPGLVNASVQLRPGA